MAILTQAYTFDPRPHYPLVITAKRYWKANSPYLHDPSSLTLVFAHGTGFHKEQWEPTIDDLYELLGRNDGMVKVREMWTIDAPNHGDAAILNEKSDGMRGLPTADYPDKLEGITLKCSRKQETACYRDSLGASRTYGLLGPVAKQVPLHLIYGAVNDYHPQEVKDDVIKVAVGGMQHLASLSRVEGTGHLVRIFILNTLG
ncbi:hypothetical protein DXG03_007567 [Asterophora parasitica]|uniref:Uncharacterized protein n=1 Tax=Asterophora parasitica TaxID=117018 RepID=A0A9P7G8T0_9AGAR|nr:hypothetical protein DXG03_007567 [Asterophora parasitica]